MRIESWRVVVVGRGRDIVRRALDARRCLVVALAVAAVVPAAFVAVADAADSQAAGFRWFSPAPAPATWGHRALPPAAGILYYPATFVDGHDKDGVARERLGAHSSVLDYLDVSPKQGPESLRDWPSYRLEIVRGESNDVHEDGHAFGLPFRGGTGSCVLDDYRTRVENHHYREIACFVQGQKHATVLVAAALASEWARAEKTLERAVDAYRVT